ncbi:Aste57867_5284 [Aphanomyces stellatus]|uniref:Aste57867_5284 protein n=1 Tax=Aphanomyces stellatus TaxID=120398 RepID=A0A485KE13_9STRA|nr:hypothetical protein As57867_005271 [Aphanomyces stellatus]VFT82353.1 Aste57867_5284 [Aphanomyces stellatus]
MVADVSIRIPDLGLGQVRATDKDAAVRAVLAELQETMWTYVGPKRTSDGMLRGLKKLNALEAKMDQLSLEVEVTALSMGVRNAVKTGKYIAEAAYASPISVGTHYIVSDDPVSDCSSEVSSDSESERSAFYA